MILDKQKKNMKKFIIFIKKNLSNIIKKCFKKKERNI